MPTFGACKINTLRVAEVTIDNIHIPQSLSVTFVYVLSTGETAGSFKLNKSAWSEDTVKSMESFIEHLEIDAGKLVFENVGTDSKDVIAEPNNFPSEVPSL